MKEETPPCFSGKRLRMYRKAAKLSRLAFCQALYFRVGTMTIVNYETGKTCPTLDTAWHMAAILGIELKDLADAQS